MASTQSEKLRFCEGKSEETLNNSRALQPSGSLAHTHNAWCDRVAELMLRAGTRYYQPARGYAPHARTRCP
eukprot:1212413-Pleurochrysis_carterae.AAC.1